MNEKRYIRFWLAVVIVRILTALMGCTTIEPVYQDMYFTGGCYTIEDTTINGNQYLIGTK